MHEQRRAHVVRSRARRRSRPSSTSTIASMTPHPGPGTMTARDAPLDRIARLPPRELVLVAARATRCSRTARPRARDPTVAQDSTARLISSPRQHLERMRDGRAVHRSRFRFAVIRAHHAHRLGEAPFGQPGRSARSRPSSFAPSSSVASGSGKLALVRHQRLDLAVDRVGDVDVVRDAGRARRPSRPASTVHGSKPSSASSRMRPTVARVGIDRGDRRLARREVVGMARVDAVPVAIGRLRQHPVGRTCADHAGDVAAQLERRLDAAVGVAEEVQVVHADDRGRRPSARRAAAAPSPPRAMPVSEPPASPSVTRQYTTSIPASVITATEPAQPKSTSSGCAVTDEHPLARRSDRALPRLLPRRRTLIRLSRATLVGVTTSPFSARELVGLLADDDRRARVRGAGAGRDRHRGGAGRHRARARGPRQALQRLVDVGLVVRGDDGTLHLLGEAFALAARAEAERAPRSTSTTTSPPSRAGAPRRSCATAGSCRSRPCTPSGSSCSTGSRNGSSPGGATRADGEPDPRQVHPDTAALRRYLVDDGLPLASTASTGGRAARSTRSSARRYGSAHGTGARRPQRPPARERDHAQQARTPELDVVPAGGGAVRSDRRGRPRQRHVGRRVDRRRSGVLLRARPPRPRDPAEHRRPRLLPARDAVDVVHERRRARDAPHPAADHRRDQRPRVRRRDVPDARRRPALRRRVRGVLLGGDHQRPHVVGARRDLAVARARSGRRTRRSSCSPGARSTRPRRCGSGWCRRSCPTARSSTSRSTPPRR